jgi:hypothetical protein
MFPLILCCEGGLLLLGILILGLGPRQIGPRYLMGWRLLLAGLALMAQGPLAIAIGGLAMGSVEPGPIDGASFAEARVRLAALLAEWGVILAGLAIAFWAWYSSPKEEPPLLHLADEGPQGDNQAKAKNKRSR